MHFVLFLLKSHCITSPHFNVNAGLRKNASLTVGFSCHIYRIKAEPLFEHKDREARWWQTFEHKWIAMLSSVLWWWRTKQSSFCTDGVERETDILSLLQKKETAQKRNSEWIKQQVGLKGDEFLFKMANTPRWNKITSDWASTAVTADSIQSDWHALHRRPRQVIVMSSDSNSPRLYRWYTKDNASNNPWLAEQTMGNLYLFIQVKTNPCGHSIHRTHFKVIDSGRGGDRSASVIAAPRDPNTSWWRSFHDLTIVFLFSDVVLQTLLWTRQTIFSCDLDESWWDGTCFSTSSAALCRGNRVSSASIERHSRTRPDDVTQIKPTEYTITA